MAPPISANHLSFLGLLELICKMGIMIFTLSLSCWDKISSFEDQKTSHP